MLSWLFRPQCAACAAPSAILCEACAGTLVDLGPACPRCADPSGGSGVCGRCRASPPPFDGVLALWQFGGQLAVAIRRLKYARAVHVARELAPLWAPLVGAVAIEHEAAVVPVPMHWRRRARRGYDHAWLLATHACREARIPDPEPLLVRSRAAPPQASLTAEVRRANLDGAFAVRDPRTVAGRSIVLLDDVVTTGATISAAARVLLAAGAKEVIAIALARATSARG